MNTTLLISLFFCHFLADYTHLSTSWMLSAKRLGKPLYPIFVHALWHGCLMSAVLAYYFLNSGVNEFKIIIWIKMVLFQIFTHFVIDVWKGKMNVLFPSLQSPANKWHWIVFGFDQFLHTVVILIMAEYVTNL